MATPILLTPDMTLEAGVSVRKPGTVLKQDYLDPRRMTISELARLTGVPGRHLAATVFGTRFITADVAVRLATVLGTSAFYWLALEAQWSLTPHRQLRVVRTKKK